MFFPEPFESKLQIGCLFTSKYFGVCVLKVRIFSYKTTVQLLESGINTDIKLFSNPRPHSNYASCPNDIL